MYRQKKAAKLVVDHKIDLLVSTRRAKEKPRLLDLSAFLLYGTAFAIHLHDLRDHQRPASGTSKGRDKDFNNLRLSSFSAVFYFSSTPARMSSSRVQSLSTFFPSRLRDRGAIGTP
jgi:hypothetical protein